MTQPSQPIPAGQQPPEPSKKPIDASDSAAQPAPPATSAATPASCPGCGQGHGDGAPCPACPSAQSEPVLEESGPEPAGAGEPLVCVRYGRMSTLGLFRSKIGPVERGLKVVIKSDRGLEIGTALRSATRQLTYEGRPLKLVGTIRRLATHEDLMEEKHLHQSEDRERKFCEEKMRERKLPMKLVAAEHLLGGDRIIFYFLSETRIDFRDLVRDLSHEYQTRIEMRQVGVRDEARLLADYERCGQFICCRAFIKEFQPVSMRMAKIQKATLDPSKISGRCGRLMCCLRYEQDTYDELRKNLPRKNSYVMTEHGPARVVGGDILTQLVRLEIAGKFEVAPLDAITARDLKEADVMAAWSKLTTGPAGPRSRSSDTRGRDTGRRPEQPAPPKPETAPAALIEAALSDLTVKGPEAAETIAAEEIETPVSPAGSDRAPTSAPAAPGAVPPGGAASPDGQPKRRRRRRGGRNRRGPEGAPDNRQPRPPGHAPQAGSAGGRPPQQTNSPLAPAAQSPAASRGPQSAPPPRTGPDDLGLPRAVLESFGAFDSSSAPPDDDGPDDGESAGETEVSRSSSAQPGAGSSPPQAGAQRHHRRGRRGGRRRGGRHGQPGQPGQGPPPGQSGPPPQPGPTG